MGRKWYDILCFMEATTDKAREHIEANALRAARTLTDNMDEGLPKDRIAAAKEVLDRAGVTEKKQSADLSIPSSMIASAIAGLGMLVGKMVDVKELTRSIEDNPIVVTPEPKEPVLVNREQKNVIPFHTTDLDELKQRLREE